MRTILDLNSLIDFRKTNLLGTSGDKTDKLFEMIRREVITSTEKGQKYFYPGNAGASGNFNRLKKSLEKRMINTLFCTEFSREDYWRKYFDTIKRDAICDMLIKNGKSVTSANLAYEALRVATKYHFTDLVVSLSRKLTLHYAVVVSHRKQYRKYKDLLAQYSELANWENKALDYYNDLAIELRLAKTIKSNLISKAKRYKDELDEASARVRTMNFQIYRYNINLFLFKMLNQSAGIVDTCQQGMAFLAKLSFTPPPRAHRTFYFNIVPAYLQSRDFKSAITTIAQVKGMVEKGSHNWIGIHQYQAILGFQWGRPEITREAIKAIYSSKYHRLIEEELKIYEYYLNILEDNGNLKLGKFLNETPHFSADKKGMNINILILQFLIFLRRNDRGAIIDRMEALQAYAYRYLAKDPTTRRSELFFRMLFLLAKSAFEISEVERRSPGITAELQETPRQISAIDIEVVPYEVLWEKICAWCRTVRR